MEILRPTLIIDRQKVISNIQEMVSKAERHGLKLSPHFKTHQSKRIASLFEDLGVSSCSVSSISMAEYFIENGWEDVTVVFPFNILEIEKAQMLSQKAKLTLLIDSMETARQVPKNVGLHYLIEIDAGYHRTGVDFESLEEIAQIVEELGSDLKGFYCHAGDSYKSRSVEEIESVHTKTLVALQSLKNHYPSLELSLGDTPSCSVSEDFKMINEIRPGNFVFYDLTQCEIGSCSENQIGCALACPVVFKNKDRLEITVYGGGVHLSKDSLKLGSGQIIFGKLVHLSDDDWSASLPGSFVKSVSQEHGILKVTEEVFGSLQIGDVIGILPVHSCMTADLMGEYWDFQGERYDHLSGPKFPSNG